MLLEKILVKEGHEVVSVGNGQKAFDLFQESKRYIRSPGRRPGTKRIFKAFKGFHQG